MFGVLGLELIAVNPRFQSDPAANAVIRENFSSLGMSMVTLTQFITMDNISAIYLPMVKLEPAIFFFFAVLILIVSVSVAGSVVLGESSNMVVRYWNSPPQERLSVKSCTIWPVLKTNLTYLVDEITNSWNFPRSCKVTSCSWMLFVLKILSVFCRVSM